MATPNPFRDKWLKTDACYDRLSYYSHFLVFCFSGPPQLSSSKPHPSKNPILGKNNSATPMNTPVAKAYDETVVLRYSPPNNYLTKSPVLKPAPGCISEILLCPLPPRPHHSTVEFCKQEHIREDSFFIESFVVWSSHETFVKENRWFFGGGYRGKNQSKNIF